MTSVKGPPVKLGKTFEYGCFAQMVAASASKSREIEGLTRGRQRRILTSSVRIVTATETRWFQFKTSIDAWVGRCLSFKNFGLKAPSLNVLTTRSLKPS